MHLSLAADLFDAVVYLTPADAEIKAVHMEHLVSFSKAVGPALLCLTKVISWCQQCEEACIYATTKGPAWLCLMMVCDHGHAGPVTSLCFGADPTRL